MASSCYPLVENGTHLLNPCGLIANSLFNGDYFYRFLFLFVFRNSFPVCYLHLLMMISFVICHLSSSLLLREKKMF